MRPLDGYPTSWGSSRASVFPHNGPASYVAVTFGPLAGGDLVQAQPESGLKFFDFVHAMAVDSGSFTVQAIPDTSSAGPVGQQMSRVRLKWVAQRTGTIGGQAQTAGAEAAAGTDLSAQTVRLLGVGPK